MRLVTQIIPLLLELSYILGTSDGDNILELPLIYSNNIQGFTQQELDTQGIDEERALKKVLLSNTSVTCNDGSQAGFYLRKSQASKKWIIFLEGGWYCYDHLSCRNRWLRQRQYMTSSGWPEVREIGGILSRHVEENPFWWDANHVFVPYCTSDSWSGTKPNTRNEEFSFMGSLVVQQVVKDMLSLGLENGTELMLTGSSAGGTGVMINLDFVRDLLHGRLGLRHIKVKGVTDSGWFLDRTPYAPTLKPAVYAIRKGMVLWQGRLPKKCVHQYPSEAWRCYFGYRLYPTLRTPLFVFQWLFDEAQMDADNVGAPVTQQQWDYIHKMGDALRQSFENVTAVFAPSCISHSVLTKAEWLNVKIDDISIAEALHCWEQRINRRRQRKRLRNQLQGKLKDHQRKRQVIIRNSNKTLVLIDESEVDVQKRKLRRKHRNNRKSRIRQENGTHVDESTANSTETQDRRCSKKKTLERCSWPQCNHSCPRLHNPFTGAEMDFIELLQSFGLDMESVAKALGIDMHTLQNMDQYELLKMLTQQSN